MGTSPGKPFVHIFGPLTELNGQEENKVADHINKGWKLETIVGIFITLAGIILVPDPRTFYISSKETVGNLMGLCAGFCYAAIALSAKPVLKNTSGYYAVFWQHLIGTIMFLFFIDAESFYGLYANWWQLLVIGILMYWYCIPFVYGRHKKGKGSEDIYCDDSRAIGRDNSCFNCVE